jgi:hypothetical protein
LGKATLINAKDISIAVGPGLRPEFETPATSPVERACEGIDQVSNTQWAYKGYEKYSKDAIKERYPLLVRDFYTWQDEVGLVDPKSDAGLCPNYHRYGEETWDGIK